MNLTGKEIIEEVIWLEQSLDAHAKLRAANTAIISIEDEKLMRVLLAELRGRAGLPFVRMPNAAAPPRQRMAQEPRVGEVRPNEFQKKSVHDQQQSVAGPRENQTSCTSVVAQAAVIDNHQGISQLNGRRSSGKADTTPHHTSDNPLFFDIETTGLSRQHDRITSLVWWMGGVWGSWLHGESIEQFRAAWHKADQVVGFNSKTFDVHWLHDHHTIPFHDNHLDLRYVAKRAGLSGGLKLIISAIGIRRPSTIDQIGGQMAIRFWNYYQESGDHQAIDALLFYNAWDVYLTMGLYSHLIGKQLRASEPPGAVSEEWMRYFRTHGLGLSSSRTVMPISRGCLAWREPTFAM